MKKLIPILFVMMIVACSKSITKEDVVGGYGDGYDGVNNEFIRDPGYKVFLENGTFKDYHLRKLRQGNWKIVGKEVYVECSVVNSGDGVTNLVTTVYKKSPFKNGRWARALVSIAVIRDGERENFPREQRIWYSRRSKPLWITNEGD